MSGNVATSTATYSVFAPILLLTRACGFLPVRIRSLGQNTSVSWSWIYYGLSLGAFAGTMALIVFGLTKSYAMQEVYNIRLSQLSGMFITILDDSYLLFTFTLASFVTPFTFKHFCNYLKCLNKADCLLKRQTGGEKKKFTIILVITLTLTIAVLSLDLYVWWEHVFSKNVSVWLFLFYNLPFYYTYFLVMVIEMNYWYLVQMINVRLANLNERLVEKYNECKSNGTKLKLVQPLKNEVGTNVSVVKVSPSDMFAKSVCNFIKVYELLFEANCAVNDYYGLNIVMVIIGCLIHLLVTPYDLYLELKFKDYTFIFPQCCWMVSHMLRLFLVIEPCHTAAQGVKRASTLVCQFLSLDLPEEVHSQLEILATQLFHCPLQYSAYDLVILDRSLLTTIAGGVTTYLVILFQFEK